MCFPTCALHSYSTPFDPFSGFCIIEVSINLKTYEIRLNEIEYHTSYCKANMLTVVTNAEHSYILEFRNMFYLMMFHGMCCPGQKRIIQFWDTTISLPWTMLLRINQQHCLNIITRYRDVIMSAMASQIPCVSIVCSTVCSGADQRNIKSPRHRPLWGESPGDRWIPLTKDQ